MEGWIYSPNFPSNYDNYLQCIYKIIKYSDDVCSIDLTLSEFDVEDTPDCSADYLDMGNGSTRMCGTYMTGTKKILTFGSNNNEIKFTFVTNRDITRKGFIGKIRQMRNSCPHYLMNKTTQPIVPYVPNVMHVSESVPQVIHRQPVYLGSYCDIYIGEVIGDLRSPGFPYGYHSNQSCTYSIRRAASDICKVELIFNQFDINAGDSRCDSDYFELPDRNRLCGKVPVQHRVYPFSSSSNFQILKFVSDNQPDKYVTGFWIEVKQLRNSCDQKTSQNVIKCDQTISGQITTIHSLNYPQFYGPSQQCVYLVEPMDQNTCDYEIELLNFNIESSRDYLGNCRKDFLQFPDGTRICGFSSTKRTFRFPKFRDRIGMFYFNSDDNHEERGYEIRVNQIINSCSHNYDYGFTIKPPYMSSTSAPYLTTQSPYAYPNTYADNNTFYNCNKMINSEIEVISSPNYPQNYPTVTRCIYTFVKSSYVCQMKIKILDMDIENSKDCHHDYLLIESSGERFCGQFFKPEDKIINYPKYSSELRLIFNSDRQLTGPGFQLRAEQIPNSCTQPVVDKTPGVSTINEVPIDPMVFQRRISRPLPDTSINMITPSPQICSSSAAYVSTFQSDNYPNAYNPFTNCVYKIFRSSRRVCRLEIIFDDFDVGIEDVNHKSCGNGYVEIDNVKYCGRRKGGQVIVEFGSDKQEYNIRFHTESSVRYGGFRIQVRQIDDNCPHNHMQQEFMPGSTESCGKMQFSERSLQILSPHYETGSYQPFLDCQYLVRKSTSNICALEVKFDAFSLEESANCYKDYLQIGSTKLCGKLPYAATKTYEFKDEEIPIKFHTDSNVSDAGFVIMVKQVQC
ncbi:cubilin-like isoform X2 [Oppia nitens]|nr:cubilin-like isoform X2 [Oppia nitens]